MANGKKIKRPRETKLWKALTGKLTKKSNSDVDRLIAAIQQDLEWDERDMRTFIKIQKGKIDWSGDARSERRTRKHIRKRR